MKKSISFWQFIGFIFTSVGGVLLHYLYEWTNESIYVAPFSGINESTWEHMKLLFIPLFLFAIIEGFIINKPENYWCIKLRGTLTGILLIPFLFYTLNGVFGKTPDWANITIFFISAAVVFIYETIMFKREDIYCISSKISFCLLVGIFLLFAVFTFIPPHIPLFKDPLTGKYGFANI